jgi:hypothetical protein
MHKHPVFHQDEFGVAITFPEDWTVEDVKLFRDEYLKPSVKFERERIIKLLDADLCECQINPIPDLQDSRDIEIRNKAQKYATDHMYCKQSARVLLEWAQNK